MSADSQDIDIGAVLPGMVLAADLKDERGAVLLRRGTALNQVHLAALRGRGIKHCKIVVEAPGAGAALAHKQARLQQRLARLFRHSAGIEASDALFQLLVHYRQNG